MAVSIAVCTPISASSDEIFAALTESAGLASFWASDSQAEPVVGSVTRMHLPNGTTITLRVDELDPRRRVVWTPLTNIARGPSWLGTTVTWDLKKTDGGATEALVQQGAWPDDLPPAERGLLTYLWAQVLRSLKAYTETGAPQPIFGTAARAGG
jgi:uncharacterized protein YndB with AHSA1/START domain